MGFKFDIQYEEGKSNIVVDALFRRSHLDLNVMLLSNIVEDFHELVKQSLSLDPSLLQLIDELKQTLSKHLKYNRANSDLRKQGNLVVGLDLILKSKILYWLHDSLANGHSSRYTTWLKFDLCFIGKECLKM